MQIKTLIKELKKYDPNAEIFLSIDGEGNEIKGVNELSQIPEEGDFDSGKVVIWPD